MIKWIAFLLTLLLLPGCAAPAEQEVSYRQITMNEAIAMMERESDYVILARLTGFSDSSTAGSITTAKL